MGGIEWMMSAMSYNNRIKKHQEYTRETPANLTVGEVEDVFKVMKPNERLYIMREYCANCGNLKVECNCIKLKIHI